MKIPSVHKRWNRYVFVIVAYIRANILVCSLARDLARDSSSKDREQIKLEILYYEKCDILALRGLSVAKVATRHHFTCILKRFKWWYLLFFAIQIGANIE
uniref:AlNc14C46G3702 protein n=1 Tax=Albugo laibachii Nc14 TaxID=890382 RepID=F0WAH6_9STRA|nr:AlNc14C46G3702 [Albugo laibachii Nc14]|eukprot:CCA18147.1 AlNc14C46G3702 [Albugo laibachii Nc14]